MPASKIKQLEVAKRREKLVALRSAGKTWQAIAEELGYSGRQDAQKDFQRTLQAAKSELTLATDEHRLFVLEQINTVRRVAHEVMTKEHPLVQHGRIIRKGKFEPDEFDPSGKAFNWNAGEPLLDDGPRLAAGALLLRLSEAERKLFGLDVPVKQVVEGNSTVEYIVHAPEVKGLT